MSSSTSSLTPVSGNASRFMLLEKTEEEITNTVLTNIIKMLTTRKLLNDSDLNKNIKETLLMKPLNNTYIIKSNKDDITVKLSKRKLTSLSKSTEIGEFLNNNINKHCILVITDISPKVRNVFKKNYDKVEFFLEHELMINLVDHVMISPHEVLSPDEKKDFYEVHQCKKNNMSTMYITDPVSRYYNMKVGDICRITRPSEKGVYSYGYRLVVSNV